MESAPNEVLGEKSERSKVRKIIMCGILGKMLIGG